MFLANLQMWLFLAMTLVTVINGISIYFDPSNSYGLRSRRALGSLVLPRRPFYRFPSLSLVLPSLRISKLVLREAFHIGRLER